jgi:hypothetical protein
MSDLLGDVLVPPDVKLTERQRWALKEIKYAAPIDSVALGQTIHWLQDHHERDETCQWCKPTGNELGRALRNKGLVKYSRKLGGWTLANRGRHTAHGASGPGELPEDY